MEENIKYNWNAICDRAKKAAEACNRNFDEILVLAVSKTHPFSAVISGMDCGIKEFGENYAQELKDKHQIFADKGLTQPVWHFIGHLQTNKVKYIAPFVSMIHSVDSLKLAEEISRQAGLHNRTIDILLQVNTSGEDSKSGCAPEEIFDLAQGALEIPNIRVRGLMTIGSFSEDKNVSIREFSLLRSLRDELCARFPQADFRHLSMGMTHDFDTAIAQGATIVRVGTAIFGARDYSK